MKTRVIRRDGETAVVIPEEIAAAVGLTEGAEVDVRVEGQTIIISLRETPASRASS